MKRLLLFFFLACTFICYGQTVNKGNSGDFSFAELASALQKECFVKWECPEGFSIVDASKEINADILTMWKRRDNKLQASPYNIYTMSIGQEAVADGGGMVIQYPSPYIFTLMPYALKEKGQYPGAVQLADSIAKNVLCSYTKEILTDRFGCNADTIVVAKMKLDKPVAGNYSHCVMVLTTKKNGLPLYFRILATDENSRSIDSTIENLLRHVTYKEGSLPAYFYQKDETKIYLAFAKAINIQTLMGHNTICDDDNQSSLAIVTAITYEESKQRWRIGLLPSARPHYLAESKQSKAAVELMKYAMQHKLTLVIKSKETRSGNLKEPYITFVKVAPMDKQFQLNSDKSA
ncbi:MAG: hypothetical protein ACI4B3_00405 [Prevotella sp.]